MNTTTKIHGNKGKRRPDMVGNQWGKARLGQPSNRKGIPCSEDTKMLISKRMTDLSWTGEKNPNWRGGVSFKSYPIEFNNSLCKFIRKRDNYVCQGCGKIEGKELDDYGRRLAIHHIDYNKNNLDYSNLITLCVVCNSKANKNRQHWISFYSSITTKIYGIYS